MATLDRADWHYGGEFPEGLPQENGGTHIGMYLTWIIDSDLYSEELLEEYEDEIKKVKNREITGRDFLFDICDEKLLSFDLNDIGYEFSKIYFNEDEEEGYGNYINDYDITLGEDYESLYEIPNTWDNYDRIKEVITKRFKKWAKSSLKKDKEL
jgi:hypothetical protein